MMLNIRARVSMGRKGAALSRTSSALLALLHILAVCMLLWLSFSDRSR